MILLFILKTVWCMNIILWDEEPQWPDVCPKNKYTYFKVQWFCFLSWRLFDVWTSLFGIVSMIRYWPQNKCRSLWPLLHGPVILPYISKTIWWMPYFHIMRVWPKLWPQNKYRSTWPIFHGLVSLLSLLNIFKIIWWMNIIAGIMDQCDTEIDLIKYM